MKAMALVAWGYLVVVLDLRINEFDLVVDFVGWMMCLTGLGRMQHRSSWFGYAIFGCLAGAIASIPEIVTKGESSFVLVVISVAELVLVFATCSGIIATVRNSKLQSTANTIRWWTLAIDVVLLLVLASGPSGMGLPEILLLVIPGIALTVWFIVFLHRAQDELEAVATR